MSFYDCQAYSDAHYHELEAKLRASNRRANQAELELVLEKRLHKRAEVGLRKTMEEYGEYAEHTKNRISQLECELEGQVKRGKFMEKELADKDKVVELATVRQIRLQDSLNAARESLSQVHSLAKQRQLDADYYEGRSVDLEAKATQAKRAQLAMQLQLEEVQQNQELILDELDGTERRVRKFSSGDSEDTADGSREILDGLKKAPSKIAAKLGTLLSKKRSSSQEQNAEGRTDAGRSADPVSSRASYSRKLKSRRSKMRRASTRLRRPSTISQSSNENEYVKVTRSLRRMEGRSKLRRAFRGKPLYFRSLAQAREDVRHQENMLNNLLKSKENEIEVLREELTNERMRNQQLHVQVKTELEQDGRREARGANEGLLKNALEAMKHPRPSQLQTMFKWRS